MPSSKDNSTKMDRIEAVREELRRRRKPAPEPAPLRYEPRYDEVFEEGMKAFEEEETPPILEAAREALRSLLDARDFLGYQLAHAQGSLSSEVFESLASHHLRLQDISHERLTALTRGLVWLLGDRVDSDVVATAFKVDLRQAEMALADAASSWNSEIVLNRQETETLLAALDDPGEPPPALVELFKVDLRQAEMALADAKFRDRGEPSGDGPR